MAEVSKQRIQESIYPEVFSWTWALRTFATFQYKFFTMRKGNGIAKRLFSVKDSLVELFSWLSLINYTWLFKNSDLTNTINEYYLTNIINGLRLMRSFTEVNFYRCSLNFRTHAVISLHTHNTYALHILLRFVFIWIPFGYSFLVRVALHQCNI